MAETTASDRDTALFAQAIERATALPPRMVLDRAMFMRAWEAARREERARWGRVLVPAGTGTVYVRFAEPLETVDVERGMRIYVWLTWSMAVSVRHVCCEGFDIDLGAPSPPGAVLEWVMRRLEDVEVTEDVRH